LGGETGDQDKTRFLPFGEEGLIAWHHGDVMVVRFVAPLEPAAMLMWWVSACREEEMMRRGSPDDIALRGMRYPMHKIPYATNVATTDWFYGHANPVCSLAAT
jgi:hypothetical protein